MEGRKTETNLNFEGEEDWDVGLIQELVRKEEEAIAAKRAATQNQAFSQQLTNPNFHGFNLASAPKNIINPDHLARLDPTFYSFSPPRGFNDVQPIIESNKPQDLHGQLGFQTKTSTQGKLRTEPGTSSQISKNVCTLEREVERLSDQLLFLDQEKLDLLRDRDEKEEQLQSALEAVAAKEAEIERLKKISFPNEGPRGIQDVDYVREASRSQITVNHVNSDHAHKIERFNNDSVWSPPWTTKETSTKANAAETVGVVAAAENICSKSEVCRNEGPNAKSDHIGTSFMAAEKKACVLIENASKRRNDCYPSQARDDTTAQMRSCRMTGTSSEPDQNYTDCSKRDISYQLSNLSYKLQTIWGQVKNERETNLVSKLFASCEMDLYSLLQDTWGCKDQNNTVAKDIILNDFSVGGHSMNVAKDSEAEKMHLLSLKLRFVLAKIANAMAPVEALIEELLEFCTLKDVKIVESALRVLNCTLCHDCSFNKGSIERTYFYGGNNYGICGYLNSPDMQNNNDQFQSENVNKLTSADKFNVVDAVAPETFSSRVLFYRRNAGNGDWKAVNNIGLDKNVPLVNQENCKKQIFTGSQGGLNPDVVMWIPLFRKLHQIMMDSASRSIKLQAISTMTLIVMKSHPGSEREQFGPILFYRSLSEILRKKVGTNVQLRAVQILFLLLNCPMLFKLFCGCKEDIQIRFNSSDISTGISGMEGTCEMVLQGLSDCISPTFHDKWEYELCRSALHVLAFIAASGNIGVACLLSSMHSGCKDAQEQEIRNDSGKGVVSNDENVESHRQDATKDENVHSEICAQTSNGVEQQILNIPMLLVALLNSELDADEKDDAKVDNDANEIFKDRATLIREAFLLLHSLASNPKYGASVLQVLTNTKGQSRLFLSVVSRITSRRIQENQTDKADIIEMARELLQRILPYVRDM